MLLTAKNLKISFKQDEGCVEAVRGIDFGINANEVLGLVGESGSGKTVTALSLMRLLSGKNCAVDGAINFGGKNLLTASNKEILRIRGSDIAMIFQEPFTSLNPVLRVGEQIDEAVLAHKKISKKDAKAETFCLLEKVKISDQERIYDSYPHLLSGGERQRVMIAMAVSLGPRLLIADEPTTALDVTIQAGILELILNLKKELNMAVLFITHDFGIVNKIADRILVMKEGRIVESGNKAEILSSPKEEYTKKLLDAVPKLPAQAPAGPVPSGCPAVIEVKHLNKSFSVEKGIFQKEKGRVYASRNINLEIKEGKTLGLVGESGSGKTTLGKLLIGLLKADSGEIKSRTPESMQIVFQDPYSSLDPRMRMQDIVLEGLTIRGAGRSERESALREVLFKVHLSYNDRLKYPHQFSGGERQRIAIARALAVKPKILILDEPVSSLDVIIQKEILTLLKELQKELFLTYVFISHDLRVVAHMADEVAVMKDGEIVELAPRQDIYAHPQHPYTKKLLSSGDWGRGIS
ncbi:MAG: ABC transporter ATP-binding protein [Omnitrophica bacterium]|nr:ABC transporter ATP-binding protein [Candidatus Omnitrophota bacterium]